MEATTGRHMSVSETNSQEGGFLFVFSVLGIFFLILGFLISFLYIVRLRHQESRKRVEVFVEEARTLLKSQTSNDVETAIELLDKAIKFTPSWWEPPLVELKARAFMRLQRYDAVVDLLHDFLPEHQGRIMPHCEGSCWSSADEREGEAFWKNVLLGQACYHLGRLEEALTVLQRAKWHSRILARRESVELGIKSCSEDKFGSSEAMGYPVEAVNRLMAVIKFLIRRRAAGEAAFAAGLYYEAVRQFSRVLDSRKGTPPALASALYLRRATAYEKLSRIPEAIADYNRAAVLDSHCVEAVWNRAILYGIVGSHSESVHDLRQLLAMELEMSRENQRGEIAGRKFRTTWKTVQKWWMTLVQLTFRCMCEGATLWDSGQFINQCLKARTRSGRTPAIHGVKKDRSSDRVTEIKMRLSQLEKLQEKREVDHSRILGLEFSPATQQPSVSAIETAYRVALLKHDPERASQFLERCAISDLERAETAKIEVTKEGHRLQRLVEAARSRAMDVLWELEDEKESKEKEEVTRNCAVTLLTMGEEGEMEVGPRETKRELAVKDEAMKEELQRKDESLQKKLPPDEGGENIKGHSTSMFDEGGDCLQPAPNVNPKRLNRVKRELFSKGSGKEVEGRDRQRRWRPKEGGKGDGGEKKGLRVRLTGRRRLEQEPGPLKAGEYDSLLRGLGSSRELGGLLEEGDLDMLAALDSLPLDRMRERGREKGFLGRGLRGVLNVGADLKGGEKEKKKDWVKRREKTPSKERQVGEEVVKSVGSKEGKRKARGRRRSGGSMDGVKGLGLDNRTGEKKGAFSEGDLTESNREVVVEDGTQTMDGTKPGNVSDKVSEKEAIGVEDEEEKQKLWKSVKKRGGTATTLPENVVEKVSEKEAIGIDDEEEKQKSWKMLKKKVGAITTLGRVRKTSGGLGEGMGLEGWKNEMGLESNSSPQTENQPGIGLVNGGGGGSPVFSPLGLRREFHFGRYERSSSDSGILRNKVGKLASPWFSSTSVSGTEAENSERLKTSSSPSEIPLTTWPMGKREASSGCRFEAPADEKPMWHPRFNLRHMRSQSLTMEGIHLSS